MLNDKKKRAKTFQSHMDKNGMKVMSKMAAKEMESTNLRLEEIKTRDRTSDERSIASILPSLCREDTLTQHVERLRNLEAVPPSASLARV